MPKAKKKVIKRSDKSDKTEDFQFEYVAYSGIREPLKLKAFIDWIALPKGKRDPKTQKDFAKRIGVSQDTLSDWKKLNNFWKEVKSQQSHYFRNYTSDVLYGLLQRAKEGRAAEVKLFLEYFEDFSERRVIEEQSTGGLTEERKKQIATALANWNNRHQYKSYKVSD